MIARRKVVFKRVDNLKLAAVLAALAEDSMRSDKNSVKEIQKSLQGILKAALKLKKQPAQSHIQVDSATLKGGVVSILLNVKMGDKFMPYSLKLRCE